jgi:hypothetical protein
MVSRSALLTAVALGVLAPTLSAEAQTAQTPAPTPAPPATGTPDVLPAPSDGTAPAADDKKPARPVTPAAGYAYADKPAKAHSRYRSHGPVVNMPGFEQTADGGSRLFVQLTQNVKVEERKAQGSITYVLKGASPRVWNNTNALVTVHFNTPVSSARLVPVGQDLHFVVELRAPVTPTWKMEDGQDKTALLAIDFPKGDYLGAGAEPAAPRTPAPAAAPRATRGKRRGAPPPAAAGGDTKP